FAVAGVVLIGFMIFYHVPVGPPIVLLPVVILIQVIFTTAIALFLAMWNLFYRDIKYLFEIVIVVWMFATSVVYPAALVQGWVGILLRLNPMPPIIEAYRSVLLQAEWPAAGPMLAVGVVSLLLLFVAWSSFHRSEFKFAENV